MYASGDVTIENSTLTGNTAGASGGGLASFGANLTIRNSTITNNHSNTAYSGSGGGVANNSTGTILNSIIAGNVSGMIGLEAPNDIISGNFLEAASANNLIGDPATAGGLLDGTSGNILGQDDGSGGRELLDLATVLNPLADNGGTTLTQTLVGSLTNPAIDSGDSALLPADVNDVDGDGDVAEPLPLDQISNVRVIDIPGIANVDGGLDIGAVEFTNNNPPVITVPADISVEGDVSGGADPAGTDLAAFLAGATATDDLTAMPTITNDAPAIFQVGMTTVTFTSEDEAGNVGTATALVTVTDTTNPTLTAPADATVEASSADGAALAGADVTAFLTGASAIDIVDADVTITNDATDPLPPGETTVTFTATDDEGNISTATAVVTVSDTTAPMLTAPADVSVEGDAAGGVADTNAMIETLLAGASATDIVDVDVTITNDAPNLFPVGDTTVTFTAVDDANNSVMATTVVTVTDTTAPTVTAPGDITVDPNVAGGAEPTLQAIVDFLAGASTTDVVDAAPVITNDAPALFPIGDTTVTFTATDASGNAGTATAVVTVNQPAGPPTVVISPAGPGGAPDPADLPTGPQPTSFSAQRSGLFQIVLTFEFPIAAPAASDIVLTNLGVDADADADTVIELRDEQITLSTDGLTVTIELDAGQATDGVYQIELLGGITGGDPFTFTGDDQNDFFVLEGDWNGSGGVNIQDFATFAYWFGEEVPAAPAYVDLNNSGGVNIQDFAGFAANFGRAIVFPGQFSGEQVGEAEQLDAAIASLMNPADTNGDRAVSQSDAVQIIDSLREEGTATGVGYSTLDANRDGDVSARDALFVINRIELDNAIDLIADDSDEEDAAAAVDELLSGESLLF